MNFATSIKSFIKNVFSWKKLPDDYPGAWVFCSKCKKKYAVHVDETVHDRAMSEGFICLRKPKNYKEYLFGTEYICGDCAKRG